MSNPNGNLKEILCLLLIATSAEAYEDNCHKYHFMTAELFIQYGLVRAEGRLFPYNLKLLIS